MSQTPSSTHPAIPFDNSYARLPEPFFVRQHPAHVPEPSLISLNVDLAKKLGLDPNWLQSPDGIEMFAGNYVPQGADPIAQAYAGHQFGGFVPQLGDGRAILLGEIIDRDGARWDLQLKGSGRTPFSRGGDGKAALGPVIREYILSEAMAALGVPTTRALAAVTTGETILRPHGTHPGAIFTRVAASHIRVGSFQYFAAQRDTEAVRQLADHAIARHYPDILNSTDPTNPAAIYAAFFKSVITNQAKLIAHWMSLGFIHGVMNTDNTAISGETIDYGPCAFMDAFHPDRVFSSIDVNGRYSWGNQANIGHWNLTRLAETLLPLLDDGPDQATEIAKAALDEYSNLFGKEYMSRFRAKFCLPASAPDSIIQDGLTLLADQQIDFTLFFRHLTQVATGNCGGSKESLAALFTETTPFENWFTQWQLEADPAEHLAAMQMANPILIPRNHRVEQAIQSANAGDFAPFYRLNRALATPYTEPVKFTDLEQAPTPEEIVHETFCGT